MSKVSLVTLANLDNPSTATNQINLNFQRLGEQVDLLLSRDGVSPNHLVHNVDMNGYRIINLPAPISNLEPARHGDIQQYVDQAEAYAESAEESADRSEEEADNAEASAILSYESLLAFYLQYGGALNTDPVNDLAGRPVEAGFFYWNTPNNVWRFYSDNEVVEDENNVIAGPNPVISDHYVTYPAARLLSLLDVSAIDIEQGQFLAWNTGQEKFLAVDKSASNIDFDDTSTLLNADNVQEAIDDLVDRTSLGRYDLAFWAEGLMENNEILFRMICSRIFWLPVGAPNSAASARVAANDETVVLLKRNGTQIGTVTFAAAGTVGTFSLPGEEVFNPGDVLSIEAPSTADTALRDVSFTLAARR